MKMSPSAAVHVAVPEDGATSNLVSLLIALATARGGSTPDTRTEDISQAARISLSKALGCMSAVDFVDSVLFILQSGDSRVRLWVPFSPADCNFLQVQGGALDLLSERLKNVATATRLKITARVNAIVEEIRKLLLLHPDGPLATSSYRALRSVAASISPGEEGPLTTMVPPILAAIRGRKMAAPAMAALAPLSYVLFFRIVTAH
jgi:U3 small nucleolar RNA-associated protein 10